jgi:hypothetical protein
MTTILFRKWAEEVFFPSIEEKEVEEIIRVLVS